MLRNAPLAALVLTLIAAPAAQAQTFKQIFFSPVGEPFRASATESYPSGLWFKGADADADGAVSLAEFQADGARFFKTLDLDGDGVVASWENATYEKKVAPEILWDAGQVASVAPPSKTYERGPLGEPASVESNGSRIGLTKSQRKTSPIDVRRGAGQFTYLNEPQQIRACDANLDYQVSPEEWTKCAARRFAALDLDHDGKLTPQELPATPFQAMLMRKKK